MYERKGQPLLPHRAFAQRMATHGRYAAWIVLVSLAIGMAGYHWIAGYAWDDAFLNAAMLLGGMGPVGNLTGHAAKIFAGTFALYSGLVFLAVAVLLLTPVFHRVLHHFHLEHRTAESRE
jgi:hypothetical protein